MSTIKFIKHTLLLSMALMLSGSVFAQEGAILGLTTEGAVIDTNPVGSCVYDNNAQVLTIETQPFFITFDGVGGSNLNIITDPTGTLFGGSATYSLNIDNLGNLNPVGSTVTVIGTTSDLLSATAYGPTLITGNVTDFGIRDDGTNDLIDIQATFTGGDLGPLFPPNPDVASTFFLNISTYTHSGGPSGFANGWTCAGATGTIGGFGAVNTTDPFDCYAVNTVKIKDKSGTNKDEIKVSKGGFRLDAPNTVDLAVDDVTFVVGPYSLTIPAGSFVEGATGDFKYKTASGAIPKIKARLNFNKSTWELKVKGADASGFAAGVPIDVTLTINGFTGTENVTLSTKGGSKGSKSGSKGGSKGSAGSTLEYKAKPKVSCALSGTSDTGSPGPGKQSCIDELVVRYDNGDLLNPITEMISKTRVAGEILHPNTMFADSVNNELAIFHTSCSKCLQCGDVDGNFTIVRILSGAGDKLAQKCLVPDASCNIIP